ncbi:MAG: substrate-binding domain-containing protein [Solirubrobacteraceae bacterium]
MRSRLRPIRWSAVIAMLTASVALAACGSSSSSSSSSSGSAGSTSGSGSSSNAGVAAATAALQPYIKTPTQINITTPLKSKPPTGKTIVFLGTSDPSNVKVQHKVQELAGLAHWSYSLVSYDPANPGTFTAAINSALAKHPQYLTESGLPPTASQLSMVKNAGAKWVLNSVYPVTVAPPVIGVTDTYAQDKLMGKIVADYFVSDSGGKGDAVIEHVPAYPILNGFTDGFGSEVKAKCPGCKTTTVNITIPQLGAGQVPSIMTSALRSNSSANYLVFDDGPFANGIDSALAGAGLSGKVKVIGEAADDAAIASVRAGKQRAWTGFDPAYQGYLTMDMAFRDAEGIPIPVAQEGLQPTQLLTKQTVDSITTWSAPTNAQAQFLKLWKLQ